MKNLKYMAVAALLACGALNASAKDNVEYVDPFIGTTNFSICNPGAIRPHGLMSVVPFNVMGSDLNVQDKDKRWWSACYEYNNKYFTGFAHVTLSGVGCPEMGTLLTMPTSGELCVDYRSYGSEYKNETARPGYYSTELTKYGIKCEVASTLRSSIERYTFPKGKGNLLFNLGNGLTNEVGASLRRVSDTEFEGTRLLGTFCYNPQAVFPMYFVVRVNKKPAAYGMWKKQPAFGNAQAQWDSDQGKYKLYPGYGRDMAGNDIGYYMSYDCAEDEQVEVQVGVSFVSIANARENLNAEQKGFEFEKVVKEGHDEWARTLDRVTVEGGTEDQRRVFYTALYHTQIHPTVLQDVNGEYPKMESNENGKTAGNRYTVYSLWDTYRNLSQLETLLYPDKQVDMINSMIDMYREWGWMPKWELFSRETWTMEGDPAIPYIADAYMRGLRGFDINEAYKAFRTSATTEGKNNRMRPDIDPYIERGYVPMGYYAADMSGDNSVSHALEYYLADNALSILAGELGHKADAKLFRQRALGYKHYYSKESGTLRPITMDGKFLSPFNPEDGYDFTNAPGFHEGSAWNYTFYAPHDVLGMAKLMGGQRKFCDKLQMVFDKGLYDPANEPDIAYAYLFSYFKGDEWRTQKTVNDLLTKYYTARPDGIPGNDDTGTMSAWAIFSMMGLYPDNPGDPSYTLTTPVFDKVTLHLDPKFYPQGDITIETDRTSPSQLYIKSMTLGGKKLNGYRITHKQLIEGKTLRMSLK
ncbi:putative alpha-1,2-mannosidase [Leyella stercorea DSM 18206]|uniref:Putative alpha-1,2-mannosidase n=1 Tax=Leyella stercorea DSM 18206 TaxID=1002367 RepID=G6AZQ4_9BACT|nr:GH92 family glycosyl hydrolase [Leyella stercorea]EHJ38235.1 putative alpha-1,2-mannosidase [Leyella stercorea DSM 18206]